MLKVSEANQIIQRHYPSWKNIIQENFYADRDYPPFHRVMMDGIAVSFKAYEAGQREFKIVGVAPAGEPAQVLKDNKTCLEVMTGTPLPEGADLVIQYEHLKIENGIATIVVEVPRILFESVHLAGSDCKKGDLVLEQGQTLNGPHAGIAASMGYAQFKTFPSPKIMIISTGDELVEVDQAPEDHQIRRSNAYALKTSLLNHGYLDITLMHLKDDAQEVASHYEKYAHGFDVMIYSGGVSKGKFDYLPNVWADMGVTKYFHEVSQRPGKPLWFGQDEKRKTIVLGLPGNPVSSLVCLHRYFIYQPEVYVRLTEEVIFKKDLTYFLPVKLSFGKDGVLSAAPLKIKNSGEFTALAGSDGFIELPQEQSIFKAGETFRYFSWGPLC